MVERWSELTKARWRPSRVRLIEPLIREGVVTGCGSPRGRPEASSIATRQRFMEPPRTLAKKSVRPSGDQTGFQSTAGSLVTSTGTGSPAASAGIVHRSRWPLSCRRPQKAMRRPPGDQLGWTASPPFVSCRTSPPDDGTTHSCARASRLQGFCPSPLEKTICLPSGDQAGS